jgi:hypothetical protein
VEIARRTRNKDAARDSTFAVLDALYDPRCFATLWAIGALGRIHYFLAVCCFGNLGHSETLLCCVQPEAARSRIVGVGGLER